MGCAAAFDPKAADFSGMCREEPLFISLVKQRVHVIVNEEGTEAAAATAIGMASGSAAPEKPREIRFDEPFVYWVTDRNGAVLFIGIVDDPA